MDNSDETARLFPPPDRLRNESHVKSMDDYKEMYKRSVEDPEGFWGDIAKQFYWVSPPTGKFVDYNFDCRKGRISIKWMEGAKTNICYNAIDRHIKNGQGDKIAFFWEGNDPADHDSGNITYSQLKDKICKFANILKQSGLKKGDRVAIYMPMILELTVAMLACARLGIIHSIVITKQNLKIDIGQSYIGCSILCFENVDCLSYSYNNETHVCELWDEDFIHTSDTSGSTEAGWSYYYIVRAIQLREVAYGKLSSQSSVYGSDTPPNAVDGDLNTYMHTEQEQSPYWIVDLGKIYQIKRIEIFNRKQGNVLTGQRLHDLDITVGRSHNIMHLCAYYVGPAQLGDHHVFECQHDEKARFLRLMIRGIEILHLAEVKVYALEDTRFG
ncbi:ACSS1_2 [Mytilus edulis]|uniref:acetate--CoA ligase n=1 Tax=Mytilus edulis TaxID=6550 RepID=A0A8S3SZ18_MYTED|nr:ACSS1_2 [Mytilus edulis]